MIQDIAPHIYDITYTKGDPADTDYILVYHEGAVLCRLNENEIEYPRLADMAHIFPSIREKAKYLFRIDEERYFELRKPVLAPFGPWDYIKTDSLRLARPLWKVYAGITGFQIHKWYSENRFCGKCGTKMKSHGKERAMKCPACGHLAYPKISPCVIVGITDRDRILLTRYSTQHSRFQKYGLVAGYAEVGECLEDVIRREVMEEVGLKVKNIRYYKSQPWSFTDTLLIGFFCDLDGEDTVRVDEEELSEATWFHRDHLPEERSDAVISLTGDMMEAFARKED